MIEGVDMAAAVGAGLIARPGVREAIAPPRLRYAIACFDRDGALKWREDFANLVTNAGRDDLLAKYFKGSAYTASWFVGLKGTGSAAAADTMGSHAGWAEVTPYSEGARQALTLGTVSSQSVSNSAAKATFSINATQTVAGAFVANDSTKGGTAGLLYSAGDFAAPRSVASGDTVQVTVTLTD
jgi:hypothetical protein